METSGQTLVRLTYQTAEQRALPDLPLFSWAGCG
jgi:hypothetical protein